MLILLDIIGLLGLWELPGDQEFVSIGLVGPAIPPVGTLMENRGDFVEELRQISLQDICIICELLNFHNHQDSCDFVPWNEDLQVSITRGDLLPDDDGS